MAKMGGLEKPYYDKLKSPANWSSGTKRIIPGDSARNGMSQGGVNKDLGGGATSGAAQGLAAGKANDGNPGRQDSAGSSKAAIQRG